MIFVNFSIWITTCGYGQIVQKWQRLQLLHKEESRKASNQKKKAILVMTCLNFSNVTSNKRAPYKVYIFFHSLQGILKNGMLVTTFLDTSVNFFVLSLNTLFEYPLDITKENQHMCLCLDEFVAKGFANEDDYF